MRQQYAEVQCPACGARIRVPANQILDVRVNPAVKDAILGGQINLIRCPRCGTVQRINLPFIYHDPAHEVALLYLPPDAGRDEIERQKVAGRLNRALLNSLPTEEQKSYLLQPETFINLESLVKRVLELEGLSEEDINRVQARMALFETLFNATQDDTLEQAVAEHQEEVEDPDFHLLLQNYADLTAQAEPSEEVQILRKLFEYLRTHTQMGQKFAALDRAHEAYRQAPSYESFLDLLRVVPSEDLLRSMLEGAQEVLDYGFFKALLARIEQAPTKAERKEWETLRERILAIRDEMMQAWDQIMQDRLDLIKKLLESKEQDKMLQSHLSELDEHFSAALEAVRQLAVQEQNQFMLKDLEALAEKVSAVVAKNIPPDVLFTQLLLQAQTEQEAREILRNYRKLLTPDFIAKMQNVAERLQNDPGGQDPKLVKRFIHYVDLMKEYLSQDGDQGPSEPEKKSSLPEGLIFAKH